MNVIGKQERIQVQIKNYTKSKSFTAYGLDIDKTYNIIIDLLETLSRMSDGDEIKLIYKK